MTHQELIKDKLFTVEDIQGYLYFIEDNYHYHSDTWHDADTDEPIKRTEMLSKYIQSLLPKTEWDVEFDENGKLKLIWTHQ